MCKYIKLRKGLGFHRQQTNTFKGDWLGLLIVLWSVCQSPEPKCKDGFKVKCEIGDHIGCDCNYIHMCYENVSRCVRTNITHTDSCGFWGAEMEKKKKKN
jgi:hypothetical protein